MIRWYTICLIYICRSSFKAGLRSMLSTRDADSEMRIGAYLAFMGCPVEEDVEAIKQLLVQEEVNQGT